MNSLPPIAEMERAYLAGDAAYNGVFYLGVRTTGIFCRPNCPARKPLPGNVEYFPTAQAALVGGYRACKRCRPLEVDAAPEWAGKLLAELERDPALRITEKDLKERGIDPATVRRYFLREYGMTFQAFARAQQLSGAFTQIRNGDSVDQAVFDSGFDSHSGFRDAFSRLFGSTPAGSRHTDCVLLSWVSSPLGPLVAGATAAGVCLLEFTDRRMLETQFESIRRLFRIPVIPGSNPHLDRLKSELADYFDGRRQQFSVPLCYPGTEFQRQVWGRLLEIPYGETRSYAELAIAVGNPRGVRAVGRVNGQNRIAIVIPCHRVVNKSGELGGYGGGLRRKQFLLNLERAGGTNSNPMAVPGQAACVGEVAGRKDSRTVR